MRVGEEAFRAVGHPFHRDAGLFRRPQADDLFRIDEDLRAEAAADVGCDDPQLVLRRDVVEGAHHQARDVRVLRGGPAGVVVFRLVVVAECRARLHGVGHEAVVDDVHARHVRRTRDRRVGRLGVADFPVVDQVSVGFGMQLRRARLERGDCVSDRRQFVVLDRHGLGRVAGLALGLGHDDNHRVADIAHPVHRQRRPGAHLHGRAVLGVDHPAADQIADAVGLELTPGEHPDDARHGLRGRNVYALDGGVGVRAPHEHRVLHAGDDHVVDVAARAGDETPVLLARHAGADAFHSHARSPPEAVNGEWQNGEWPSGNRSAGGQPIHHSLFTIHYAAFAPAPAAIAADAARIALTMLW